MKKIISAAVFLLLIYSIIFAQNSELNFQDEFSDSTAYWKTVLTGEVIGKPVETSYGFALISDSRTLSGFNFDGKKIWEKNTGRIKNARLFGLSSDFLALSFNDGYSFSIINPTGSTIFTVELETPLFNDILEGRDGRFFVSEKNSISCYGITGICKWKIKTDNQKRFPISELPDGSFLVFLEDVNTSVICISPFGEELFSYNFSESVLKTIQILDKLIIQTENSLICYTQDAAHKLIENWKVDFNKNTKIFTDSDKKLYSASFNSSTLTVNEIDLNSGEYVTKFSSNTPLSVLDSAGILQNKFYAANKNHIIGFSQNGNKYFDYKDNFPESKITGSIFINQNMIIKCFDDWSIKAFKLFENNTNQKIKKKSYILDFSQYDFSENALLTRKTVEPEIISAERFNILKNGNYGKDELKMIAQLQFYFNVYNSYITRTSTNLPEEKNLFDLDVPGVEKLLNEAGLFSSDYFTNYLAEYIRNSNDKNLVSAALTAVSQNGYDPEGKIISAIEAFSKKITVRDESHIKKECDALYSIVRYMGDTVYKKRCQKIIAPYLSGDYSENTKKYVRLTLKKISEIK